MSIARKAAVVAVTATVALVLPVTAATAQEDGRPKEAKIVVHAQSTSLVPADLDCAPPPPGALQLEATGTSNLGFTLDEDGNRVRIPGDTVEGTDFFEGCFNLMPDGSIEVSAEAVWTVTVDRCGTGTVQLTTEGTIGAPDETGNRHAAELATFIGGSGTGGLHRVAGGSFLTDSTVAPDQTLTGVGIGSVLC
jgi:hypothetical protein